MSTMTRGPLPPGVYWRRRGIAALVTLTLVVVLGRILAGGSDASDGVASDDAVATQMAAEPSPTKEQPSGRTKTKKIKRNKNKVTATPTPTPTPLADPSGPCADADLVVTPVVPEAVGGSGVPIVLQLRTKLAQACTWRVSADHVTVKITSDGEDVWSTLDCPGPVPVRDVVVRRDVTSTVGLVWGAKRSDDTCSALTQWAFPGSYEVVAAALGGEPSETTFELTPPDPEVIVKTPKPGKKKPNNQKKSKQKRN